MSERKIQYRVWDKTNKKMSVGCGQFVLRPDGIVLSLCGLGNSWNSIDERTDVIALQNTGLKDKNGKEIFEGDILKLYYTEPLIGFVKFCYSESNVDIEEWRVQYAKWVMVKFGQEDYTGSFHLSCESYREIIGNIYENPELLLEQNS